MNRSLLLFFALFLSQLSQAQVNAYAQVTALSGTTLTIGASNESYATFQVGKKLVLMQMQDNVIGTTTNTASFGSLGAIERAGTYSIVTITNVTRSGGTLTGITFSSPTVVAFSFGANSSVQAITFEKLGENSYVTVDPISALPWDGQIGGVVAFEVQGALTLQHSISANGAGFRGGASEQTTSGNCEGSVFRSAISDRYAFKGEGIYKATNTGYVAARGRILNGGGGGNEHNGGGGGGGNYTAGGPGGNGWSCGSTNAGGLGGMSLGAHISGSRVFMGGGGGGGEGNNGVATAGGRGGGIILIKAGSILTTGTCGITISANGIAADNSGNDGAGGGGAGGSVIIETAQFTIASGCPVSIQANGGHGGTVLNSTTHGAGGGGGQGVVWLSTGLNNANVTIQTNNGSGGCNNSADPCTSAAGSGTGTNGIGQVGGGGTVMPVELLYFDARGQAGKVFLQWATGSERESSSFTVERSWNGMEWSPVITMPAAGNSVQLIAYSTVDDAPLPGLSYYRLRQTDLDGSTVHSDVRAVDQGYAQELVVYPNPATDRVTIMLDEAPAHVRVVDDLGRLVFETRSGGGRTELRMGHLPKGVYGVLVEQQGRFSSARVMRE
jgi:hypothetical protein